MVSPEVRKMVSNQKEKEHFPPDPLFEKNKKALPLSRECGARAHTHARGERLAEAGLVRVATMSMKLKAKSSQAA
jgi:hypothetical protein